MNKRMTLLKKALILLISSTSLVISQKTIALEYETQSTNSPKILGYPPILLSVGAVVGEYDSNEKLIRIKNGAEIENLKVGDLLFIPRMADTRERPGSPIPDDYKPASTYSFADIDGDRSVNTNDTDEKISIEWFILESDVPWHEDLDWTQLTKIPIGEEYINNLEGNEQIYEGINVLQIPPDAVGKRIGFTYIPESASGMPRFGPKMYVWDIAYYFGQYKPKDPGWPIESHSESEKEGNENQVLKPTHPFAGDPFREGANPGFRGELRNLNIPEDTVIRPKDQDNSFSELTVVFKVKNDLGDFIMIPDNDEIYVNSTYQAEVKLPNDLQFTDALIEEGELSWVLYRFSETAIGNDGCDAKSIEVREIALEKNECLIRSVYRYGDEDNKVTVEINSDGTLVTRFTTQTINEDANIELQELGPDYSEQGFWFEIHFDDKKD